MDSTRLENFLPFSSNLKLQSANSFSLEESKICCLGKGKHPWLLAFSLFVTMSSNIPLSLHKFAPILNLLSTDVSNLEENEFCCLENLFQKQQILDSSKHKEFADENFKIDENGRSSPKWLKKYCGKRSNLSIFNIPALQTHKNKGFFGRNLTYYHTMPHFDSLKIYSCGKHHEKRRNCL